MFGAQMVEEGEDEVPLAGTLPAVRRDIAREIRSSQPTISSCLSAADLRAWLHGFARGLGFYGARYVHIGRRWWSDDSADMPVRFLTTSDREADQEEHWLVCDPNVESARTAFAPFAWSTRIGAGLTDMQRSWLERERIRGVAAGIAVPVQDSADGPAYLSLYGYDETAVRCLIQEHAPELAFLAAQFHALAKQLVKIGNWAPELSDREIECLRLAAHGWTIRESGEILGVSKRTVEYHLQKAMGTLGAETKIRAVVIAFGSGLARV